MSERTITREGQHHLQTGLSAAILDDARDAVVESRIGHDPWIANEIRLSIEEFEQIAAIKAREIDRGIRPTLMGLFAVPDASVPPGHYVIR